MIFGEYPCCGAALYLTMPDKSPVYISEDCPHCGLKVWHRLSRVQSASWIEIEFLAEHEVNTLAKTVLPKPGTEADTFDRYRRISMDDRLS